MQGLRGHRPQTDQSFKIPILMDQFVLSAVIVGGLVSAMLFATILAQVPFGVALERKGSRFDVDEAKMDKVVRRQLAAMKKDCLDEYKT